uniref:Transmembrane protein n=1 Tax=Syphacia muris TaxID=451379 RepID=A0A0N5AW16_9BILA
MESVSEEIDVDYSFVRIDFALLLIDLFRWWYIIVGDIAGRCYLLSDMKFTRVRVSLHLESDSLFTFSEEVRRRDCP